MTSRRQVVLGLGAGALAAPLASYAEQQPPTVRRIGVLVVTQSPKDRSNDSLTQALRELERVGIVRETTGRARGRIYSYERYIEALNTEIGEGSHAGVTRRDWV